MSHRAEYLEALEELDRQGRSIEQAEADRQAKPAPRHAYSGAELVTDYWNIECRLRTPIKWRIRRRGERGFETSHLNKLRLRLAELREAFGVTHYGRNRIVV